MAALNNIHASASISSSTSKSNSSTSCSENSESESDNLLYPTNEPEAGETSWDDIYTSLKLLPFAQKLGNSHLNLILNFADKAALQRDFFHALKLYLLGLKQLHAVTVAENSKNNFVTLHTSFEREQRKNSEKLLMDKLFYALQAFSLVNKDKNASKKRRSQVSKILDSILYYCHLLSKIDCLLLQSLAGIYFSCQEKQKALHLAARAVDMNPTCPSLREMYENMCCHLVERWHFIMLNDRVRNRAYQKTIQGILKRKGRQCIVCDVGCGTGILSLFACQQRECSQVFAIEKSITMCEVASDVFKANTDSNTRGKIKLVNKMSTKMSVPRDMPCKADILVTETFDAGLFGEGILTTLCHAWAHLLQNTEEKKAEVVPRSARLFLMALESQALLTENRFVGQIDGLTTAGLYICGLTGLCTSDPYTAHDLQQLPGGYRALTQPLNFLDVNFNNPQELFELNKGKVQETLVEVTTGGRLDAVAVWFSLLLDDSLEISTEVGRNSCWDQAIFPVHPFKVRMQPASRGAVPDVPVMPGDKLHILFGVLESKLCLEVTAVSRPDEISVNCDSPAPQLLQDTEVWWQYEVFPLPCAVVQTLNDTTLSAAYHQWLLALLSEVKQDNLEMDFIHISDGFSPLCLQAVKGGFSQAVAILGDYRQKVLLWKLAALNSVDVKRLQVLDQVNDLQSLRSGGCNSPVSGCTKNKIPEIIKNSKNGVNTMAGEIEESRSRKSSGEKNVIVAYDVVDTQGRLVEGLQGQLKVLRGYLSKYQHKTVAPHTVEVYGVLVNSTHLLRLSRVLSDNTLGFNITSFINKYSTRNHQDVRATTLPHTCLTEPFKMFTLNLGQLLGVPGPTSALPGQTDTFIDYNEQDERTLGQSLIYSKQSSGIPLVHSQQSDQSSSNLCSNSIPNVNDDNMPSSSSVSSKATSHRKSCCSNGPAASHSSKPCSNGPATTHSSKPCSNGPATSHSSKPCSNSPATSCSSKPCSNCPEKDSQVITESALDCLSLPQNQTYNATNIPFNQSLENLSSDIQSLGTQALSSSVRNEACIKCSTSDLSNQSTMHKRSFPFGTAQDFSDCSEEEDHLHSETPTVNGSVKHKKLSLEAKGLEVEEEQMEIADLTKSVHLKVPVTQSGQVTAMIYWFVLHLSPTCSVSTNDPLHHWNQAAVIAEDPVGSNVTVGSTLNLRCQMDGSAFNFVIE